MSAQPGRGNVVQICDEARALRLNVPQSGLVHAEFPYIWLRDACQSATSVDPSTRQKLFKTSDIPLDIAPTAADIREDGMLHIHWNKPLQSEDNADTKSILPLDFLARHASSQSLDTWLRFDDEPKFWDRQQLNKANLFIPYTSLNQQQVKAAALRQAMKFGIVFVKDLPTDDKSEDSCALAKLAGEFGLIRRTWYGDKTWDVKSQASSKNIAYTNLDLGLHMDLVHFHDPPRFQMLHYLFRDSSLTGGSSYFVDAYHAAHLLQQQSPDMFSLLCSERLGFEYVNAGHFRYNEWPTIQLDPRDPEKIEAINYSPPFQAPLRLTEKRNSETLELLLAALKQFATILESPELRFTIDMQPAFEWDSTSSAETGRVSFSDALKHIVDCVNKHSGSKGTGCYLEGDSLMDTYRSASLGDL